MVRMASIIESYLQHVLPLVLAIYVVSMLSEKGYMNIVCMYNQTVINLFCIPLSIMHQNMLGKGVSCTALVTSTSHVGVKKICFGRLQHCRTMHFFICFMYKARH